MKDHKFIKLGVFRHLVWDLMKDTDTYYLNHHILLVDFINLEKFRNTFSSDDPFKPSYVCLTMFAMARALHKFPRFNTYLRTFPFAGLAVYKNIDIAYTAEKNTSSGRKQLTLSILKNCQNMSLRDFIRHFNSQKKKDLENSQYFKILKLFFFLPGFLRYTLFRLLARPFPSIMRNIAGTAAFTSVGKFGTDFTTPLSPKSMTLSLGAVKVRPLADTDGSIRPGLCAYLTFTYDHRIADGRDCAEFAVYVKNLLENKNTFFKTE